MRRLLAVGLVVTAVAAVAGFLLAGAGLGLAAGGPLSPGLAARLSSPGVPVAAAVCFCAGVLLAGRRGGERFATLEVLQVLSAGAALGCGVVLVVGVGGAWSRTRLGVVAGAGLAETALALGLALRAWQGGVWRRDLLVPGVLGACLAAAFWLGIVALGVRG